MKNTECKKYYTNDKYCDIPEWFKTNIKMFFFKWYQIGVEIIGDVLSADGSFMSKTVFSKISNFKGYAQCRTTVLSLLFLNT